MKFIKYQALGNDYLVFDRSEAGELTEAQVRRICDRHYGPGSDGILVAALPAAQADSVAFTLRIFNPDGSQAEKSGNGLRIFARYLWDQGRVAEAPFTVETPGGQVRCQVHPGGRQVTVEMGRVSFDSRDIPVSGPPRLVLDEVLLLGDRPLRYSAATIGNPHCVVIGEAVSPELAQRLGPVIEHAACFPRRTNVQFLEVLDHHNLRIEIWERGAGYTLASGSSSCAAAAVAYRLGYCAAQVAVHMPGGKIEVEIAPDFAIRMSGPVARVYAGTLDEQELLSQQE